MYIGPSLCEYAYMDATELLLRLKTGARLLGLKPDNLQCEVTAGKLPAVKVGDQYLYPVDAIRKALQKRLTDTVQS